MGLGHNDRLRGMFSALLIGVRCKLICVRSNLGKLQSTTTAYVCIWSWFRIAKDKKIVNFWMILNRLLSETQTFVKTGSKSEFESFWSNDFPISKPFKTNYTSQYAENVESVPSCVGCGEPGDRFVLYCLLCSCALVQ